MQHRNTPLADLMLSPAQILLHRQLRDKVPTHPKHLRLHKKWIMAAKQRELLLNTTKQASLKRYNKVSRKLDPLNLQTKVLILSNNKNPRWNRSGRVVMKLPFRKYRIKLDGSGRVIDRNRRFLRPYEGYVNLDRNTEEYIQTFPTTNRTPVVQDTDLTVNQAPDLSASAPYIPKQLLPHNNRGLCEQDVLFDRKTTRSGREY